MDKPPSLDRNGNQYAYHVSWAYWWLDARFRSVWRAKANLEMAVAWHTTPEQHAELEHLRILIELARDLDTTPEPPV